MNNLQNLPKSSDPLYLLHHRAFQTSSRPRSTYLTFIDSKHDRRILKPLKYIVNNPNILARNSIQITNHPPTRRTLRYSPKIDSRGKKEKNRNKRKPGHSPPIIFYIEPSRISQGHHLVWSEADGVFFLSFL